MTGQHVRPEPHEPDPRPTPDGSSHYCAICEEPCEPVYVWRHRGRHETLTAPGTGRPA